MDRSLFFFFNDTATTEIYTLSLHDALPIYPRRFKIVVIDIQITLKQMLRDFIGIRVNRAKKIPKHLFQDRKSGSAGMPRPISYAVFCLKKKKKHDGL